MPRHSDDDAEREMPFGGRAVAMACAERLILHRIARHDDSDPRPALELVVRAALAWRRPMGAAAAGRGSMTTKWRRCLTCGGALVT
jgi:hypothetical protein